MKNLALGVQPAMFVPYLVLMCLNRIETLYQCESVWVWWRGLRECFFQLLTFYSLLYTSEPSVTNIKISLEQCIVQSVCTHRKFVHQFLEMCRFRFILLGRFMRIFFSIILLLLSLFNPVAGTCVYAVYKIYGAHNNIAAEWIECCSDIAE